MAVTPLELPLSHRTAGDERDATRIPEIRGDVCKASLVAGCVPENRCPVRRQLLTSIDAVGVPLKELTLHWHQLRLREWWHFELAFVSGSLGAKLDQVPANKNGIERQ